MFLLIGFAFLAGIVTILSPCILPILPIVLSGAVGGPRRPWGIIVGFVASFTFFTLTLTSLVQLLGISSNYLRLFSVVVIGLFGLTLAFNAFQDRLEVLFSRLTSLAPRSVGGGFLGGVLIGLSLGLVWTPCVGPILASVITLSLSGQVTLDSLFITMAYATGTAIPMIVIQKSGQSLIRSHPGLLKNTPRIQRAFGALMILTAIAIATNFDRQFQTAILQIFPQYGQGLTSLENNQAVLDSLDKINPRSNTRDIGKPLDQVMLPDFGPAPELIQGGVWINSEPLKLSDLKGKVVLVDFWTYSCINCIRTLPFLKKMDEKYRDLGLVIIGVHSPEFEFERDENNVKKAVADFEIKYPIMQDNAFATWHAYSNRYWPAKYLIDRNGHIRYTHFGEGEYDTTEMNIQKLIEQGTDMKADLPLDTPDYQIRSRTPELYLGLARQQYFAASPRPSLDDVQKFVPASPLPENTFAIDGQATFSTEYVKPSKGAKLILNYESTNVYLVGRSSKPIKARVTVDGQVQYPGADVGDGVWEISTDRLYHLVSSPEIGKHQLTIEFLDDGGEFFAFTFG